MKILEKIAALVLFAAVATPASAQPAANASGDTKPSGTMAQDAKPGSMSMSMSHDKEKGGSMMMMAKPKNKNPNAMSGAASSDSKPAVAGH